MNEIFQKMQGWAESGAIIPPGVWIDEALKLLSYIGKASDALIELDHQLAKEKWNFKSSKPKVTNVDAENYIETLDLYVQKKQLESDIKLMNDYVLMAKKRATLADTEIKY